MADSFSPLLNLRLQQTGGNTNTWGDLLNSDTITLLENAVAGRILRAVTGGTLDLSATPLVEQLQIFSGVLVSDLTVIVPAVNKRVLIQNATSGAFAMVIKSASSGLVAIPQGTIKDILINSGGPFRWDAPDVGEIVFSGRTSAPAGFFECDGSAISRANYPELFFAIGTTFGAGNGSTTFNVPDLKTAGRFPRSRSGSVAVGTAQAADIAAHNHTASASTLVTLTILADGVWTPSISISDPGHSHTYTAPSGSAPFTASGAGILNFSTIAATTSTSATGISATSSTAPSHNHSGSSAGATTTVTVNNSTGTETRPVNISLLACIRY